MNPQLKAFLYGIATCGLAEAAFILLYFGFRYGFRTRITITTHVNQSIIDAPTHLYSLVEDAETSAYEDGVVDRQHLTEKEAERLNIALRERGFDRRWIKERKLPEHGD